MLLGSIVWTLARLPAARNQEEHRELLLPGEWSSLLPAGSVVIVSARPLNDVRLRAEVVTHSEDEARNFTQQVATYLALFSNITPELFHDGCMSPCS